MGGCLSRRGLGASARDASPLVGKHLSIFRSCFQPFALLVQVADAHQFGTHDLRRGHAKALWLLPLTVMLCVSSLWRGSPNEWRPANYNTCSGRMEEQGETDLWLSYLSMLPCLAMHAGRYQVH